MSMAASICVGNVVFVPIDGGMCSPRRFSSACTMQLLAVVVSCVVLSLCEDSVSSRHVEQVGGEEGP